MKEKKVSFLSNISEKFKNLEQERRKIITIVAIIVIAIVIVSIITSIMLASSVNSADKVAGNLNNAGFAVKKGNKAYVSNTLINSGENVEKGIYEIGSNNTSIISKDEYVKSINMYKGYIYYLAINKDSSGNYIRQVIKMKPNGDKRQVLVDNIETTFIGNDSLNVSDGWIYYLNAEYKIEKIKINGEKRQQIADEEVAYFQISGKNIYYVTKDDDFKRMAKDGTAIEQIEKGIGLFQIVSNNVYYISKSNRHLVKMNLKDKSDNEIIDKKIKTFNVYGKTIYYATAEEGEQGLYKVKINGKNAQKLTDLLSENNFICVVGDWIYYTDKIENSPYYYTIYRVKTNGKNKERVNNV